MDFLFGNSYIEYNYTTYFLRESYSKLKAMMNSGGSTITVHVMDITGIFDDVRTFEKSKITKYGPN